MKVKIIEYFWAVGHRTRRTGSRKMKLEEGQTMELDHMIFKIEKIEKDLVLISVNRTDSTLIKEIRIEKGKRAHYRPMSMDAGHMYVFKLTRLL